MQKPMQFRKLKIGDTFDFVSPNHMMNSFYLACKKISDRLYIDAEGTKYQVGRITACVYHVGDHNENSDWSPWWHIFVSSMLSLL